MLPDYGWLIEYNPLAYVIENSRHLWLLNTGTRVPLMDYYMSVLLR
jgi:ABC-type polysaccharide/polyol phosphate export permease